MSSYKTYDKLTKDGKFSEKQSKVLIDNFVEQDYFKEQFNYYQKETKSYIQKEIYKVRMEIKDVKISMLLVAIAMTSTIIAAIKFL